MDNPKDTGWWAAYGMGLDDAVWCNRENHDAQPPDFANPEHIAAWLEGYAEFRGKSLEIAPRPAL